MPKVLLLCASFVPSIVKNARKNRKLQKHSNNDTGLDVNILTHIFGFLNWKEILNARVCREWREAAKLTIVPYNPDENHSKLVIRNHRWGLALGWIAEALPNLQVVQIPDVPDRDYESFILVGDNPRLTPELSNRDFYMGYSPPMAAPFSISPISKFRHLRHLIINQARINGPCPCLFDFPHLRILEIENPGDLQWDLNMLVNLPKLEKLHCVRHSHLTGSLENIRVLRDSLEELCLSGCEQVQGSLMDISDFPKLKSICLQNTKITGDIRDIGPNDFKAIKYVDELYLGDHVYGGEHIPSIKEAPEIMLAWSRLTKRNPNIYIDLKLPLSPDSTLRFNVQGHPSRIMPAKAELVKAGNRLGWRWTNGFVGGSCETHWLDPEPDPSEDEYEDYTLEVYRIEKDVDFFRGFFVPPTQEEHRRRSAEVPFNPRLTWYGIPRYS